MKTASAKLYPTPTQERTMLRFLNVSRWVYNKALEHRIKAWSRRRESVNYNKQQSMLTAWRGRMEWIRLVPAQIERDALRRVDRGFKAFFRRVKAGEHAKGFPRFKGRLRWRSFEVLQVGKYQRDDGRVYVPGVGPVRCRGMREFTGAVKGVRVIYKPSGWYVQLIVDNGPSPEKRPIESSIGIDVGLTHFATTSDGGKVDNPRWHQRRQRRLKFLQRIASRRVKGSNRRRVAFERVALFHERTANRRKDWIHKLTRKLVDQYDLIAIEGLNLKGLSRSRLAKSIHDAAWGQFATTLELKAESAGVTVVRVDPRGTSQECSGCGATVQKTLREREHVCTCGLTLDRDMNAARNILRRASAGSDARGEYVSRTATCGRRDLLNRELVPAEVGT